MWCFSIRAERMDLCFELETLIMAAALGDAVAIASEVQGFQYFDNRDLLGFVDGSENPQGQQAADAVTVGDEDPAFAGGSATSSCRNTCTTSAAGTRCPPRCRSASSAAQNSPMSSSPDGVKPTSAHNALTIITDENRPGG